MVGGFCYHLVIGNILIWGNVSNYAISYFKYTTKEGSTRGYDEPDTSATP